MVDLLKKLEESKDRFEAAILVRALACQRAAKFYLYGKAERIIEVEKAEILAESLERDYVIDDEVISEENHPWKEWLVKAGFDM